MNALNKQINKTLSDLHYLKARKAHRLIQAARNKGKEILTRSLINRCNVEEAIAETYGKLYKAS